MIRKIDFRLALEDRRGELKVDILLHDTDNPEQPLHRMAKEEGIRLF